MDSQPISLFVSESAGSVSAELVAPADSICIMTLAHGAGAGMNHLFMVNLANALAEARIATLRFNFPFAEHKKFRPDVPAVAHRTIEAAIATATKLAPSLPLFAAGKSFGGRMSSQYLSTHPDTPVQGIIFYGFPLHPAGKPSIDRAEHLKTMNAPMLFLQGTRDELATWSLIEPVCSSLTGATLVEIEGADHSFKAGKTDTIAILRDHTKNWLQQLLE